VLLQLRQNLLGIDVDRFGQHPRLFHQFRGPGIVQQALGGFITLLGLRVQLFLETVERLGFAVTFQRVLQRLLNQIDNRPAKKHPQAKPDPQTQHRLEQTGPQFVQMLSKTHRGVLKRIATKIVGGRRRGSTSCHIRGMITAVGKLGVGGRAARGERREAISLILDQIRFRFRAGWRQSRDHYRRPPAKTGGSASCARRRFLPSRGAREPGETADLVEFGGFW
jgi:hypothetical protein